MLARNLNSSRKLKHLLSVYVSNSPNRPASRCSSSNSFAGVISTLNSLLRSPFSCPSFRNICSQNQSLNYIREGNFDENASLNRQICPGCGVPMQDSDCKLHGFFVNPTPKNPYYKFKFPISRSCAIVETEVSDSMKMGDITDLVQGVIKSKKKPVVCARCHSLRHYDKVKDVCVENLLPDYDLRDASCAFRYDRVRQRHGLSSYDSS